MESYTIVRSPIREAQQEIDILYQLLQDAEIRLRRVRRIAGIQTWYDWLLEIVGY